jgi:hypothetical protein
MTEPVNLFFNPQLSSDPTAMSVNYFRKMRSGESSELLLRPAFQRNLVWNDGQKSFLVDSILRGLPVPELYVQMDTSADGNDRLMIVDGQQRISTCLSFTDDELRLDNSDDLDPRWRGKFFSELDDDLKAKFLGFKFVARELPATATEIVLREIFRRLNRTVEALVAQELRHAAYTGPFIQLVERAGTAAALNDLGVFTPQDYKRRRNDEFVAEILMAIDAGAFPNKKEGLEELFSTYERRGISEERLSEISRRFGRALNMIDLFSGRLRKTRFRNKSDCYSLMIFLARNAEHLGDDKDIFEPMIETLVEFSALINEIKREEGQGKSTEKLVGRTHGGDALAYLRAVERAASDRLSRVRRNDALEAVLGNGVRALPAVSLSASDEKWSSVEDRLEETQDDGEDDEERRGVQASLLGDG